MVCRVNGVLSLVGVDEDTEEHVAEEDEALSADKRLPEIPWLAHLTHKFAEQHRAAVGVDSLHKTVDRCAEADAVWGRAAVSVNDAVALWDVVHVRGHGVVWRRVCNDRHGHY